MVRNTTRASGSPAAQPVGERQGVQVQGIENAVEHPSAEGALLPVPGVLWDVGDVRDLLDQYDAVHLASLRARPRRGSATRSRNAGANGPSGWGSLGTEAARHEGPFACRPALDARAGAGHAAG